MGIFLEYHWVEEQPNSAKKAFKQKEYLYWLKKKQLTGHWRKSQPISCDWGHDDQFIQGKVFTVMSIMVLVVLG